MRSTGCSKVRDDNDCLVERRKATKTRKAHLIYTWLGTILLGNKVVQTTQAMSDIVLDVTIPPYDCQYTARQGGKIQPIIHHQLKPNHQRYWNDLSICYVLCTWNFFSMYIDWCMQRLGRIDKDIGYPETEVIDVCELPYGCSELNPGLLQDQQVLCLRHWSIVVIETMTKVPRQLL